MVAIGGGTGLSTLLRGLKAHTPHITAIVTVADHGGSSGRLRRELGVLPPGDFRNCFAALADDEALITQLFQYRFGQGEGLNGHSFGNLFITAMIKITGDFEKAVKESSKVLAIRGRVIPSTLEQVRLIAEYNDGSKVLGESKISEKKKPIKKIFLNRLGCEPTPEAINAIKQADTVIIGPGSLYTSIIPNLLIEGITKAILESKAIKIYVCNIMTQHGETDGYSAYDHLNALVRHSHLKILDYCIVNSAQLPQDLIERYREEKSYPILIDSRRIRALGYRIIEEEIVTTKEYIRHDPPKLAKIILGLIEEI